MDENLAVFLTLAVLGIATCSFLAVSAWSNARRREREAFYRAEAIKKVAEMQGTTSEPVLALLREALKPPPPEAPMHPLAAMAFHKSDVLRRIAEMPGAGPDTVREIMREEERSDARRKLRGARLGGLVTAGAGAGLIVALEAIVPETPVYLVGVIPILIGAALLAYSYVLAPAE